MKHAVLCLSLASIALGLGACGADTDPEDMLSGLEAGIPPGAGGDAAPWPAEGGTLPMNQDAGAVATGPDAALPTTDAGSGTTDAGSGTTDVGSGTTDAGSGTTDAGSSLDGGGNPSSDAGSDAATDSDAASTLPKFSFFVTSLNAMRTLSKSENGFGGDLRFGETGEGAGLRGADKICAAAAEMGMPGASAKQWRAFLSTSTVNARTRIGQGPWYDRMGRLIAMNLTDLLKERPEGAPTVIRDDLPNELGVPNKAGSAIGSDNDNHDTVTGTNASGDWDGGETCSDWTSTTAKNAGGGGFSMNGPRVGHSWPSNQSGRNWMQAHRAPGCAPGVNVQLSSGAGSGTGIGNGGGYGGIYCFALTP